MMKKHLHRDMETREQGRKKPSPEFLPHSSQPQWHHFVCQYTRLQTAVAIVHSASYQGWPWSHTDQGRQNYRCSESRTKYWQEQGQQCIQYLQVWDVLEHKRIGHCNLASDSFIHCTNIGLVYWEESILVYWYNGGILVYWYNGGILV